jgi:hypothetical protein
VDVVGAAILRLATADDQHILVAGDLDLVAPEPGHGKLDPILMLAFADEVERAGNSPRFRRPRCSPACRTTGQKPTALRRKGAKSNELRISCPPDD